MNLIWELRWQWGYRSFPTSGEIRSTGVIPMPAGEEDDGGHAIRLAGYQFDEPSQAAASISFAIRGEPRDLLGRASLNPVIA